MNPRKRCETCGRYLIAFHKHYLHPEKPCAGITDCIDIVATKSDESLYKLFIEKYGKPDMDDSDAVTLLEEENDKLYEAYNSLHKIVNKPLIKFIIWFFNKFKPEVKKRQ